MDIDEKPGFFLFVKFVNLFHLVDIDVIMVTNIINFLPTSIKFNFTFLTQKITIFKRQTYFSLVFHENGRHINLHIFDYRPHLS